MASAHVILPACFIVQPELFQSVTRALSRECSRTRTGVEPGVRGLRAIVVGRESNVQTRLRDAYAHTSVKRRVGTVLQKSFLEHEGPSRATSRRTFHKVGTEKF
jgi:hypothetical protein